MDLTTGNTNHKNCPDHCTKRQRNPLDFRLSSFDFSGTINIRIVRRDNVHGITEHIIVRGSRKGSPKRSVYNNSAPDIIKEAHKRTTNGALETTNEAGMTKKSAAILICSSRVRGVP
jgi:hypothetical protein